MPTVEQQLLNALAGAPPEGLSAPEIAKLLKPKCSQPTVWRALDRLRTAGQLVVSGRARATRYHAAVPMLKPVLRSRALHAVVAGKLAREPRLRDEALRRLERLRSVHSEGRPYHDHWQSLLEGPLPSLLRTLTEISDAADTLRKESPFTALVTQSERERVFRSVRD